MTITTPKPPALTTDEGRRVGSFDLGTVHLQVLQLQLAALRRTLAQQVVNDQIIRPLVDVNFGSGPYPRFEFDESVRQFPAIGE